MKRPNKVVEPIQAAGGIVFRDAPEPLIAIVRLRKDKAWVLPKGKLKAGEDALAAARREVTEETGHDVAVHDYLGEMSSAAGGRPKIVRFWRMRAGAKPVRELMRDVKAVKWLPLERAVATLTHAHEQTFLAEHGPAAAKAAKQTMHEMPAGSPRRTVREAGGAAQMFVATARNWLRRLTRRRP